MRYKQYLTKLLVSFRNLHKKIKIKSDLQNLFALYIFNRFNCFFILLFCRIKEEFPNPLQASSTKKKVEFFELFLSNYKCYVNKLKRVVVKFNNTEKKMLNCKSKQSAFEKKKRNKNQLAPINIHGTMPVYDGANIRLSLLFAMFLLLKIAMFIFI